MAFYDEDNERRARDRDAMEDYHAELADAADQIEETCNVLVANQDLPESVRAHMHTRFFYGTAIIVTQFPAGCENTSMEIKWNDREGKYCIEYQAAKSDEYHSPKSNYTTADNVDDLIAVIQRLCVVRGQYTKSARSAKSAH